MGYCMDLREQKFFIAKRSQARALKAALELCNHPDNMAGGTWERGVRTHWCYAWVDMEKFKSSKTLVEAIHCWGWEPEVDEKGNIVALYFERSKIGQEEILFAAIAPWVKAGSYLEMIGEDGTIWRWVFDGKSCREVSAKITWE